MCGERRYMCQIHIHTYLGTITKQQEINIHYDCGKYHTVIIIPAISAISHPLICPDILIRRLFTVYCLPLTFRSSHFLTPLQPLHRPSRSTMTLVTVDLASSYFCIHVLYLDFPSPIGVSLLLPCSVSTVLNKWHMMFGKEGSFCQAIQ